VTDAQRISTLLHQGFSADAIAAILDTDLATVSAVQLSGGSLPSGGGGGAGLVLGAWEEVDLGGPTIGADPLVIGSVEGPCEYEFQWVGQPNQSGGFQFSDVDTSEEYGFNMQSFPDWTPLLIERFMVPAGANVQVRAMFSAVDNFTAQRLRRRTLS
jgi:hypothetical protein